MCSDLDKKCKDDNLMIKVDLSKAYDRIQWGFIIQCLRHIGFEEQSMDIIFRAIKGCHFSINWVGSSHGFFPSLRGLRQGDPLSPTLFVITMDVFSRMLNEEIQRGNIHRFSCFKKAEGVSDLLYADDMLIFSSANRRSIANLIKMISIFCKASGHSFNPAKTKIYFGKDVPSQAQRYICSASERLICQSCSVIARLCPSPVGNKLLPSAPFPAPLSVNQLMERPEP